MEMLNVEEFSYKKKKETPETCGGQFKSSCDWKATIKRKIPITTWLPQYNTKSLFHDLLAGFTVALTEIPQSIAYAGIAGLPLQYGLYSSFMGGFVYAIFGSCRAINMGSTSIMALLIQPYVSTMGVNASIFMSLVGGMVILLLGLMNLGFVIEFFSYPVMSGFTSAAAVTIASSQIKNFLGISGQTNGFLQSWGSVIIEMDKISKWDAILGSTSLILLIVLKEIGAVSTKKQSFETVILNKLLFFLSVAKNAIVVTSGMVLAYYLETKGLHYLQLTGSVEGGFPHFEIPTTTNFIECVQDYNISLIFIPLVAILETIAIAKVFAKGKSLDASQEMVALGIANIMGAFVQSMPVTGSFTRTAVNNASGAKSNMAAVFTGVAILISLPFLTSTFYYIPKATLAAVIICAMFYLFDFEACVTLWKNKKIDLVPFLVTLMSSLIMSLEYGILIGIGTHLSFVLYSVSRPYIRFQKITLNYEEVLLITLPSIYFPAADFLRNTIMKCESDALIILDGKFVHYLDVTIAKSIAQLVADLEHRNQKIVFINFHESIEGLCTGVDKKLKNCFRSGGVEDVIQDQPSARLNEIFSIQ